MLRPKKKGKTKAMLSKRLTFFTVLWVFIVLLGVTSINFIRMQSYLEEQNRLLQVQALSFFRNRMYAQQQSLGIVTYHITEHPDIQQALLRGDRDALQTATTSILADLAAHANTRITVVRFYLPPGLLFIDASRYQATDRIHIQKAETLEQVFSSGQAATIWALEAGGITLLDIHPIIYEGRIIAALEVGTVLDNDALDNLTQFADVQWQISARTQLAQAVGFYSKIQAEGAPTDLIQMQALSGAIPVFNTPENYTSTLQNGTVTSGIVRQGNRTYSVLSAPITDNDDQVIGVIDIIHDHTALRNNQFRLMISNLLLITGVLLFGGFGLSITINRAVSPISNMRRVAEQVTAGNYDTHFAESKRQDEIGQLARALNTMINQVRDLIANLDARVHERTQALERRASLLQATSDVGNILLAGRNIDQALHQIALRISDRFGFYHVGIFILDERNEYAVLRAANSAGGQRMLERKHKLRVGQVGIVGYVAATGQPRIALDVGQDAVYFDNPDLPETRSEMALPIIINQQIIGVLDIQSREANAFTDEDIHVLQALANQIAIALENANLYEELQQANQTLNQLIEAHTLRTWREFSRQHTTLGFISVAQGGLIELTENQLSPAHQRALAEQRPQITDGGYTLIAPIILRRTTIGLLRLSKQPGLPPWSEEEENMVAILLDHLAAAIENARLYTETRQQALIDRAIGDISSRLAMAVDVESILREATVSLGRYLSNSEIIIKTTDPHPQEGGAPNA